MKTGYDQFFKQAQKVSQTQSSSKKQKLQKPQPEKSSGVITKKKKSSRMPWGILISSAIGLFIAVGGYLHIEDVDRFLGRIEVQFLGTASAQEEPSGARAAAPVSPETKNEMSVQPQVAESSGYDHLLKIKEKNRELQLREEELARAEAELEAQKVALEKRMEELNSLRRDISSVLENKVKIDDQKVETLVQVYTNMKPAQAAKVIETLDEDLAVEILNRMKKKSAADIMNMLKPEKAQIFTEKLAGFKR